MTIVDEVERNSAAHIVWINEETRIASFHAVEGYIVQTFSSHEFFMNYIHSLQERCFRFQ